MEILTTIFYFIIVIGILVFAHEFGHFIAARLTKTRAEVFAIGMGPRLFGYNKVNGFTFGKLSNDIELGDNTDFRICAFPIGGYVKIAGMIDESMDKKILTTEPQPWEYRSKPVLQRMFIITAGVVMNLILAFLVFYALSIFKGKTLTETTTVGYISPGSVAESAGFKIGDKILSINSEKVQYWDDLQTLIYLENLGRPLEFQIERNGNTFNILIPKENLKDLSEKSIGIYPDKIIPVINEVIPNKPAEKIGLTKGDIITEFAGEQILNSQKLVDLIKAHKEQETEIKWLRDGKIFSAIVKPDSAGTIGIGITSKYEGPSKVVTYNVLTAFPKAAKDMYFYGFEVFVKSIVKIIKGEVAFRKAIGGPIKIAQASAQSAEGGFFSFIGFLALLSLSLAIINILPFPALDGGHFVILLIEAVTRKPLSYKVQIAIQNIGFILLLAFMLFVIYNDIVSFK